MMEKLITKYPGKPIVILTPLHRLGEEGFHGDGSKAQLSEPLIAYVRAIREVAEHYSLPVLDVARSAGCSRSSRDKENFVPDGCTPMTRDTKSLPHASARSSKVSDPVFVPEYN